MLAGSIRPVVRLRGVYHPSFVKDADETHKIVLCLLLGSSRTLRKQTQCLNHGIALTLDHKDIALLLIQLKRVNILPNLLGSLAFYRIG